MFLLGCLPAWVVLALMDNGNGKRLPFRFVFWAVVLVIWFSALFYISANFEGALYQGLVIVHFFSLWAAVYVGDAVDFRLTRNRTKKEIKQSTDVEGLRSYYLDNDWIAPELKKAAQKRIYELDAGTSQPQPEPRREHKSLSVEKQDSRYISGRSFDELREESLEIDREVRRDYTLTFIATGVFILGCIVAWIWGAPLWAKISLFVLSVLGIAVSVGFIWGMRQDRDWQGIGNVLSDDPNNWSDAILRKRAVSVQSQMDDKKPFDEQPIPSSSEAQALEVLGMTAPYTLDELKKRRNIIIRKIHPDQGGSALMVRLVNEAFDVLKAKK